MTPASSTTIGWRKPNCWIDAATASTASSLWRGLFSYGRIVAIERIATCMTSLLKVPVGEHDRPIVSVRLVRGQIDTQARQAGRNPAYPGTGGAAANGS